MNRRQFGKQNVIAAGALAGSLMASKASLAAERPRQQALPLVLNESTKIAVLASEVQVAGKKLCPVSLSKIKFSLDHEKSRLTAKVTAGVFMYENVDYDVSGAVFDADGELLGAVRVVCKVERLIERVVVLSSQELILDFGRSGRYRNAKSFQLCLSDPTVGVGDQAITDK